MTNIINKVIKNKEISELTYVDLKGNRSVRLVEPYEIKNGKLYAYCLSKNSIRAFTITSISSLKSTGKNFVSRF